jgi:transposase
MTKPMTMQQFFATFPDDETCLDHLFVTRYGSEIVQCPKCSKVGKFHRIAQTLAYSCSWCGHHIHPMVDTPFEKSHTSLQRWYYAMYLFSVTRHSVSGKELQRQFGCSYKTAWRMGHEIRKYMGVLDGNGPLDGHVEVDETYIGGKDKEGRRGRSKANKTIVFAMLDRETGEVISKVIPDATNKTIHPEIEKHITKGATVHTDEFSTYRRVAKLGYKHEVVRHVNKEYARGGSHVNSVEGYFSLLKRSIRSTHIWVSEKHMPKYLAEFEYRTNLRRAPALMFLLMLSFRACPVPSRP